MKAEEKFKKLIEKKGWEVNSIVRETVTTGRDGRDGGWFILINEDEEDYLAEDLNPMMGFNTSEIMKLIDKMPQKQSHE